MTGYHKPCPRCGAALPAEASFCPHCAETLRPRKPASPPAVFPRRRFLWGGAALMLLAAAAALMLSLAPDTYDGLGQVLYTDDDGTYQLLVTPENNRFTPQAEVSSDAEEGQAYRIPSRLFVNHVDSGANAGQMFLQKVDSVSTQILQPEDSFSPMTCTLPETRDFAPEAARVTLVDFTSRSEPAELVWTLHMQNGDVIRLRQKITPVPIQTYDFYPEDHPMDTPEQLQSLVDQVTAQIPLPAVVNLHLPAVTYDGGLTISGRPVNLYGSQGPNGCRTTFTDTVLLTAQDGPISYFYDIDFTGDGTAVGVSASARFWAEGCTFTGWKTGVLGYGDVWVNVIACRFEDNTTGFHFNSTGQSVTHTMFNDNVFVRNGTAVLLEHVPTGETMNFQGSRFAGNHVDIDNRCDQSLDISQAVFE